MDTTFFTNSQENEESDNPFSLALKDMGLLNPALSKHKVWLSTIRRERPNTAKPYKIGIYIRFFNQTKHSDYLDLHKKQFVDVISLCPKWELVGFYIDEGPTAPYMESAPEWSRLLNDCLDGKVDLILTQKISNISKDMQEAIICARLLASLPFPVGIYFISEDIFTLASYYQEDLHDTFFLPSSDVMRMLND